MVYKRGDGRWVVKLKGADGKWHQSTYPSEADAQAAEAEALARARAGARMTVGEAAAAYSRAHRLAPSTRAQYAWLLAGASAEEHPKATKLEGYGQFLTARYCDSLTRADLEAFRDRCRDGGCSEATVDIWESKLRAILSWAASEEFIAVDPWGRFRRLRVVHEHRTASLADLQAVYPHLPPWLQWAARTAVCLCLRPGPAELWALEWRHVDFGHGSVTVPMPKVHSEKTVYPPKSWMQEARARYEAAGCDPSAPVCPGRSGGRSSHAHKQWGQACRRAGVKPFAMYALRHIAATEALAAGADIAAVAANLGHSTPVTTLRTYAHTLPAGQKAAAEVLDGVWNGDEKK